MRALSIMQPWAWLIVHGHKDIENRTWPTAFRGRFLVHAGKTFDWDGFIAIDGRWPELVAKLPKFDDIPRGGIVGEATLIDSVTAHGSEWFNGPHGFLLRDAKPLPFRPLRGMLGFFSVPDDAPASMPRAEVVP